MTQEPVIERFYKLSDRVLGRCGRPTDEDKERGVRFAVWITTSMYSPTDGERFAAPGRLLANDDKTVG